jgi:hypothetical protein
LRSYGEVRAGDKQHPLPSPLNLDREIDHRQNPPRQHPKSDAKHCFHVVVVEAAFFAVRRLIRSGHVVTEDLSSAKREEVRDSRAQLFGKPIALRTQPFAIHIASSTILVMNEKRPNTTPSLFAFAATRKPSGLQMRGSFAPTYREAIGRGDCSNKQTQRRKRGFRTVSVRKESHQTSAIQFVACID